MKTIVYSHNEDRFNRMCCGWRDVMKDIMKRKANGQKANLFSENNEEEVSCVGAGKKLSAQKSLFVRYSLGAKYGYTYFTKREAECMVCFLNGKTIGETASVLELSPRTVEYYVKNMKEKVGCHTKRELISLVYASEFVKNIDFSV